MSAQSLLSRIPVTPAASAVLKMVPKLPGSWMLSKTSRWAGLSIPVPLFLEHFARISSLVNML